MKTLKNKNIVRLLILISLIVVVGISFIVTTAVYKGTHIGSGSLVLDKGIYIDISDVSSGELSKNMEMPIQYYLDKVTSETNRVQFSVKPSSESEYYIANPTITAQESSQAFYLRLKLNAQYYVNGSSTPTTFSMSASEKNTLFQLFATDSNYSPVLFNDCFAADANGEYYYYVSGGYGVATKNNLAQVTSGMEISLFKGFLANGTTPVSVINFREFEKVPENVTNITLSLDIELAIEPNNWNLPDVTLLTENDVTVSLVDNEYEITKINTSATSYALPGYYQGNAITRIGTTSPSALDDDAITVWFANTMTHIGGYSTSKIQKFYLGNNVTEICEWAFYGTNELSGNLVLPISITKIGDDSFGVVTTISCLFPYLPNCEYFGSGSFKGDSGFYGILSVRGVIGSTAFANVSVRTLNIEAGTTSIGTDSFYGMQGLRRVFIDSSAIAGLASSDSCLLDISNNVSLQDVYIKDGLTIGAYFTSDSNFVETESNVAGYRHFGRSYQLTFNGGNIDGTLDAKLWNYAGSAGYSSSNTGNNGKYSFSGKNATTKIGINGINTFYLPMPIISGYTFDGWYTTANGSSETVKVATADGWIANVSGYTSENGSWIRASATTLYAHYTKKEYSISYDFAGGTKGTNAPSSYIFGNTTAISNPTRKGYLFTGWNISVSLTGRSLATIDINTGVQEYVASYPNAVYYELFYAHKDISYTAALSGGQIRWRGYTTAGAYSSSLSSSSNYTLSSDAYVALWYHLGKKDNNTIYTYNYIGDNLSIDSLQVGNLTLTAKWKPITYTIQYNGNGNTGGSTANSSHTYDQAKALTANGFKKTGYTFNGWNTKADGTGTSYGNAASVTNLTATNGAKITLYAQWRENVLTIRYHLNGGTSVSGNSYFSSGNPCKTENWGYTSSSQYGLTNYDDTKRVTRTGYLANTYYNTKANGSGNNLDDDSLTTTIQIATAAGVLTNLENGDTTIDIYMIWTPMTFDVSFDANGGNVAPSTISVSYGSAYGELPTPSRTGYTFAGWLGGSKNLLKGSVSQNGWSGTYSLLNANTNKFSFRVHTGGSAGSCWRSFYIDVSKYIGQTITISGTISAINPTNGEVSYISVGQGNNDSYPYHIAGSSDSKRIYNKGDAVGTTFSHTCTIIDGTSIMGICIWANITAANGYVDVVFDNLQIEAGNKATAFENPNTVITANSKVTLPYAHTLTAKWTPKEYTVTFNANGGTTSTASKKVTYDSTYGTLPTPSAYSKTGYIVTFNGWYTAKTGGTHVTASTTVKITGNQTLYAHWIETPITYTIVYNGNGYTNGSTASSSHTYNVAKNLTANGFGKTGYTFAGWNTKADGTGTSYANSASVTNLTATNNATVTLYAKWTPKQITVSFNPSQKGGLLTDVANGTYSGNNATITYTSSSHQYKFVNSSTNDPYVTIASTVYLVAGRTYTIHAKMRNTSGSVISGSIQIFYAINQAYNESDSRRLSGGEGSTTLTVSSTGTYNIRIDNDYDKDIVIYEFYIIEGDFITSKTVTYDSTYGTLPTPLREGYTFAGWYTLSSGGSQITDSTKVTKANDYTLFAHWTENTKAYLMTGTNWQAKLKSANSNYTQANIESIEFTKTKPTSGTRVSVGAVNSNGTSAYVSGTSGVSDVTAYVTAGSASGKYKVVFYSNATIYAPVNSSYLFSASTSSSQLKALKSIAFNNFNTSNVTNMSNMFDNCALLTSLDLSKFDTSKVTNMQSMFNNCRSLTSLNLTSFNTAKVTNMRMMFYSVNNVSLNLSKFDTSNVTNMSWMFAQANIPSLSNFNTAKVTDMSYMFFLSSATSIDLSSFNTSNVTNMSYMFSGCGNLSSLDLSNFDMSKVTNTNYMLNNFTELGGFTTLKTPKKLATTIALPFDFVNTSGTTTYTQVSTSMTNMTLLRKWYRVTCPTSGNWEKSQLTCSVDGLVGSSDGVRVAYNTTITFWLKTTGYWDNYSYIYMTFSGFAESEVTKGSSSGNVDSWRVYYSGSQRYASMIIDNEQFEIGITDDRTNVEEIELKDTFIIEDHDDEIVPMWFMPLISCQLVCKSTVSMKAYSNITAKITSDCYIAAAAGSGKGYKMGSYI